MKVSTKLGVMEASLLGVVCVATIALTQLDLALIESKREGMSEMLRKAEHLVRYYQSLEAGVTLSRAEAQEAAKIAIAQLNKNARVIDPDCQIAGNDRRRLGRFTT